MGLLGFLVYFGAGGDAYANTTFISDELLENLPAIIQPERPVLTPRLGRQYTMKFVTPGPDANFKIRKIVPDPSIDYKIRIAGPNGSDPVLEKNGLGKALLPKRLQPK
jgi:hypothetical protein